MLYSSDANASKGKTFERIQEYTAHGVPHRKTETGLKWTELKLSKIF
jgi:hypothetical protein